MPSETSPSPDRFDERAGALVSQASQLVRWATRTTSDLARKLPGAAAVETELHQLERTVLGELRRRLDNVDPLHDGRSADGSTLDSPARAVAPPKQTEPLRVAMAELLLRSMEQTKQRAKEYLYLAVLRQLLPDEARILSALADGSTYPVIHVDCRHGVSGSRRLLSNASTVGRAAGASELASVPRYLTRLLHLDLVEIGDADPSLSVQYDILLTDDRVRTAEELAREAGRARIVRQTVHISSLGRELWDACHPHEADAVAEPVHWQDLLPPEPIPAIQPTPTALPGDGAHFEPATPSGAARNGTSPAGDG
ncbi:Abi-alpha family protein [Pseudonocardia sp. GCM10023141]|uniref:Abi-alpha family protein n=1 Tax=Pseudonocardia sp. GCM10023141 TaxID=3252653 RepID=UPI003609CB71